MAHEVIHRVRPLAVSRQSPYNWGKSTQTFVSIAIRPVFIPKRCCSRSVKDERERMVRPSVKISLKQYKELNTLRREKKEPLSKLIREALSYFTKKKVHSTSILPSFLPASSKDKYKTVTAYFPRHEWNLLKGISKNTGRRKTNLLREAVKKYLKQVKPIRDRIRPGKTQSGDSSADGPSAFQAEKGKFQK